MRQHREGNQLKSLLAFQCGQSCPIPFPGTGQVGDATGCLDSAVRAFASLYLARLETNEIKHCFTLEMSLADDCYDDGVRGFVIFILFSP